MRNKFSFFFSLSLLLSISSVPHASASEPSKSDEGSKTLPILVINDGVAYCFEPLPKPKDSQQSSRRRLPAELDPFNYIPEPFNQSSTTPGTNKPSK